MKKSQFGFLSSMIAVVGLSLFAQSASAQFHPGKEGAFMGGTATMLTLPIKQLAPGVAELSLHNINAVYLKQPPKGIKAHWSGPDATGKGTAHIVDVVANAAAFADTELCWRGVGSDWNNMACGPIHNGQATVVIDTNDPTVAPPTKNEKFALVPILRKIGGNKQQVTWVAHPDNTRTVLDCPHMKNPDAASVFLLGASTKEIRLATQPEVQEYQKDYVKFCKR